MDDTSHHDTGDVLIVEDERPIAELIETLLADEGYHVRSVRNAEAAWQAITATAPALLLLDILMPGLSDGADLARKVRAAGYTFPIIIIAATERLARPLLDLNPIAYVPKPFDLDVLLREIAGYVSPPRQGSARIGPAWLARHRGPASA
jgi:two-component system copper resistance phosphate regulon response regulator CusR